MIRRPPNSPLFPYPPLFRSPGYPGGVRALLGLVSGNEVRDFRFPVVHAVNVHASSKQIRGAGKPKSGEIAAVATAPEPDAAGGHVRAGAKINARALDVGELAGAQRAGI